MNASQALNYFMTHDYLTVTIPPEERSRLFNSAEVVKFAAEEEIFTADDPAAYLYYVTEGRVALYPSAEIYEASAGTHAETHETAEAQNTIITHSVDSMSPIYIGPGQYCGHEAGLRADRYIRKAVAQDNVTLIKIPAEKISLMWMEAAPLSVRQFIMDLLGRFTTLRFSKDTHSYTASYTAPQASMSLSARELWGWVMVLLSPGLVSFLLKGVSLAAPAKIFCVFLSMAVTIWVFALLPAYVPGLLLVTSLLVTNIAPQQIILSGFASEAFLIALSVYGLGHVMASSGIMYRFLLLLLKYIPPSQRWLNISLFFIGTVLSFTIPSTTTRNQLMVPYLFDIAALIQFRSKTNTYTRLLISAFTGTSVFSAVFLSGSLHNFILLGLLWPQDQEHFQWVGWLQGAALTGGILFGVHFLAMFFMCWKAENVTINRQRIDQQYRFLGKMRLSEQVVMTAFLVFVIGIVTSDIHHLSLATIGLLVLLLLLSLNVLTVEAFRKNVDWPSLLLLASLIGVIAVLNYLQLHTVIIGHFGWLGEQMKNNFALFVLMLAGLISFIRLFIPYPPATIIIASLMIPLAQQYEVNAWLICFITLVLGKMWFLPYQFPPYLEMREVLVGKLHFKEKTVLAYNLFLNLAKITAILLSIPYWVKLGLL
jgi:di/tricarboxylate transporter